MAAHEWPDRESEKVEFPRPGSVDQGQSGPEWDPRRDPGLDGGMAVPVGAVAD